MHKIASIRTRHRRPSRVTCPHAFRASVRSRSPFAYDPLGRLSQVNTAQATWTYQYDANGNRTLVQLTPAGSGTANTTPTSTPSTKMSISYL
jgi:YD repeat-containing protein